MTSADCFSVTCSTGYCIRIMKTERRYIVLNIYELLAQILAGY